MKKYRIVMSIVLVVTLIIAYALFNGTTSTPASVGTSQGLSLQ